MTDDGIDVPAIEPVTLEAVARVLALLQPGADARRRGCGLAPVNRLLLGVVGDVAREEANGYGRFADVEFAATLTAELARRYLRAVRHHARGTPVAQAWQVVLDGGERPATSPLRLALAGVNALVDHDLALALVSACTLLGRSLGEAERRDVDTLTRLIADRMREAVVPGCPATAADVHGVELLLACGDSWWRAQRLWTLRGRPTEAEAERASVDLRASLVGRGLLVDPAC